MVIAACDCVYVTAAAGTRMTGRYRAGSAMHIAILTFDGFNELDSLIALASPRSYRYVQAERRNCFQFATRQRDVWMTGYLLLPRHPDVTLSRSKLEAI